MLVVLGSPKPVNEPNCPASSRNGSTLEKFGWLNTFWKSARNSNVAVLAYFEALQHRDIGDIGNRVLHDVAGELPNGVPNTLCAVAAFMMNRTWLLVTGRDGARRGRECWIVGEVQAALTEGGHADQRCIRQGTAASNSSARHAKQMLQASPAKIPTAVCGALRLPRNGRA